MGSLEYHLNELEIAKDEGNSKRIMPEILPTDKIILDIGCGIGQTFVALECTDRICIGLDVDEEAIKYGLEHFGDKIQFLLSDSNQIPIPSDCVDLIFSRVSLPYTNIPVVVKEMSRLLRKDGRVWMTFTSKAQIKEKLKRVFKEGNVIDFLHKTYVLLNGYVLKYFGFCIPFINGKYETWQDVDAMSKLLLKNSIVPEIRNFGEHIALNGIKKSKR